MISLPITINMFDIRRQIITSFKNIFKSTFPSLDENKYHPQTGKNTDYQFGRINLVSRESSIPIDEAAILLCNALSTCEFIEAPQALTIKNESFDTHIIIVFNVSRRYLEGIINNLYSTIMVKGCLPSPTTCHASKNVLLDFSSPNIAKEMHIGHLRSTIIGESLSRILEYCGSHVQRVNHLGDWGTPVGMLIAYIKQNNIVDFNITELMSIYRSARELFDNKEKPEFTQIVHQETVNLQKGLNTNIWQKIYDISLQSLNQIYQQLGTNLEIKGESFYQSRMVALMENLKDKIIISDGKKILHADETDIHYILEKSHGGFTYDTSDLAAIHYRLLEEKVDEIIYVVDLGQRNHFETLFKLARTLGWADQQNLYYVGFGVVLGPDNKKIKTRAGMTIRLQDLLDQAYQHAYEITQEMSHKRGNNWDDEMVTNISRKIAVNCIKYSDLSNPRSSNYRYNITKMLNLKGNTAVYLMYAMARCKSIMRKIDNVADYLNGKIIFDTNESINLSLKIIQYHESIVNAIDELSPHYLCNYLYDLVNVISSFYEKNVCISFHDDGSIKEIFGHRIRLIHLSIIVVSEVFQMIGLETVDEM
jgi:arginyl-tRNA synthetase